MTRTLWLVLAIQVLSLALVSGCCGRGATVASPRGPDAVQRSLAVEITRGCAMPDGGVSVGFGSGALISESTVLTASHVVLCPGATTIVVLLPGSMRVAQIASVDPIGDLAILVLDAKVPGVPIAKIGPRPKLRERVCIATARPERKRRCGAITGFDSLPGDVRHEIPTEHGNSGSGVYDARGLLVGIVTHACRDFTCGLFTALEGRLYEVKP